MTAIPITPSQITAFLIMKPVGSRGHEQVDCLLYPLLDDFTASVELTGIGLS